SPSWTATGRGPTVLLRGDMDALAMQLLGRARVVTMPTPIMGAEDFSYVLQQVCGALAFLGGRPRGTAPAAAAPNHSNRVVFDDSSMATGVAVYAGLALDTLR
ncbi:MAG: M20/M25/M40 family metallo-hydrolase, partial [Pseudonocardia sp.]